MHGAEGMAQLARAADNMLLPADTKLWLPMQAFNNLSAVIWVHGADMANMVFLPENATAIQIIPDMQRNPKSYAWPEELVRDLPNRVSGPAYWAQHGRDPQLRDRQASAQHNGSGVRVVPLPGRQCAWHSGVVQIPSVPVVDAASPR